MRVLALALALTLTLTLTLTLACECVCLCIVGQRGGQQGQERHLIAVEKEVSGNTCTVLRFTIAGCRSEAVELGYNFFLSLACKS